MLLEVILTAPEVREQIVTQTEALKMAYVLVVQIPIIQHIAVTCVPQQNVSPLSYLTYWNLYLVVPMALV
jgi:hypothetical protein